MSRLALLAGLAMLPLAAPAAADPRDPLIPLVLRMDRYFQRHETDGVTMDSRYAVSPSEAIRQSVVCQVLGYAELLEIDRSERVLAEIEEHADYLIAHLDAVRSHTPFDGMLGYALLAAHEATGEARFLASAETVVAELMAMPTSQLVLNGGLMTALATAQYSRVTGDLAARQKTHDIIALLAPYQNADGSFPHWCFGSKDIHYTGWIAVELIHLERMTGDPLIEPMLALIASFLEARVGADGRARYEEPCPGVPGCTNYYYSRASGCGFDHDTRGWTVEPAYTAMLLDRYRSPSYLRVMDFLVSLETQGTFADLWDYWPPPDDPEYPWTVADTSVANMSIIFWTLAGIASGRSRALASYRADPEGAAAPRLTVLPNPARDVCRIRVTLARPSPVSATVHDAAGREVRRLGPDRLDAGAREIEWDLRDAAGRPCPNGLYWVRVRDGSARRWARLAVVR